MPDQRHQTQVEMVARSVYRNQGASGREEIATQTAKVVSGGMMKAQQERGRRRTYLVHHFEVDELAELEDLDLVASGLVLFHLCFLDHPRFLQPPSVSVQLLVKMTETKA